jgi:hypothetical protein
MRVCLVDISTANQAHQCCCVGFSVTELERIWFQPPPRDSEWHNLQCSADAVLTGTALLLLLLLLLCVDHGPWHQAGPCCPRDA